MVKEEYNIEKTVAASIVVTPINEYIVINHKNPDFEKDKRIKYYTEDMKFVRKGMVYCEEIKSEVPEYETIIDFVRGVSKKIKDVLLETPDFEIEKETKVMRGLKYSIPSGKIEKLIDDDYINKIAEKRLKIVNDEVKFCNETNRKNGINHDFPYATFEDCKSWTELRIYNAIYEQMIRKSAKDIVEFVNPEPLSFVYMDEKGLMIVDEKHEGYGQANALLFEILEKESKMQRKGNGRFEFYTVKFKLPTEMSFKFLSGGNMIEHGSEFAELEKQGVKFTSFENKPAMIYPRNFKRKE